MFNAVICACNLFAVVEETYKGPVMADGQVTKEFMSDLMEWYKSQKVLHRKYAYKVNNR